MDAADVSAIITALAALVTSTAMLVTAWRIGRRVDAVHSKVDAVHHEVKTLNSQTIAQLADADETRRIMDKFPEDRTEVEEDHLKATGGEEL